MDGSILIHTWSKTADMVVHKYIKLVRKVKRTRVEKIVLSGILPVITGKEATYRNCKRRAISIIRFVGSTI